MNGGIPIIGPLFGMVTGNGWQSGPACGLYHDFNGRYTSVCGL
jgi:D-hexose-6-phosphate mutarotase